jgi:hypothetical protein
VISHDRLDIDRIAFIGRTYDEYLRMFELDENRLRKGPVLDCASGPASFAAEANQAGFFVTACDVLYDLSSGQLLAKGIKDIEHVFDKFDGAEHLYTWKHYKDKEKIMTLRQKSLKIFTQDFESGCSQGLYVQAALPWLPFAGYSFSLVLSSHFLFLYGDRLGLEFHRSCLTELVRVSAEEVRIFPLQGLDAKPYPHMDALLLFLASQGICVEIVEVPFEFQKGSNKMMRLYRAS